jgi:AcrR family transcriptional regulator
MATASKPLRADAQRNRDRLVAAGREVFAERGFQASLDDVAHHAGVGVGTAYRRFPNKEALIDEIFEERVNEILDALERALDEEDAWIGLQQFIAELLEFQSADRGLKQAFHESSEGRERVKCAKERFMPLLATLVERSKEQGSLRADATVTDVLIGTMMIGAVIDATRDVDPDAWRRYLTFALDGFAADRGKPTDLPIPSLTPEQFDEALSTGKL